ncbi:MAG: magnesium transporter CorA family protein [Bacteroides sp.]|nr:magnesium transporter CorA family protein [Bacteroides sp.]MCM1085571.1 magnesium transporter CorA family protein [Bacteroides sp.]
MMESLELGALNWHYIQNPNEEDLTFLEEEFHFHPLDIEDCRSMAQRPKIDIYDDYNFLILHFPGFDRGDTLTTREIKIFWGKSYIITLTRSQGILKNIFELAEKQPEKLEEDFEEFNSDTLLYTILNRLLVDSYSLLLRVGVNIESINRDLFNKRADLTIEKLSITRRNIILLNTIFKPQLRLFQKFESGTIKGFSENSDFMEDYWGNIVDYYQKMWDMVEDNGELIEGLSKTFDSMQTNRINEVMKIMTLISTIFLPLTFITGVYGMNVNLPFMNRVHFFWCIVGFMALVAGFFIFFAKKRRWM